MTPEHLELLTDFLKKKGTMDGTNVRVLFYDPIDQKRVDLPLWFEPALNEVCIGGDEGEMYELSEVELIDTIVLYGE